VFLHGDFVIQVSEGRKLSHFSIRMLLRGGTVAALGPFWGRMRYIYTIQRRNECLDELLEN